MNMPNLQDEMVIKVVNGMDQIPAEQWDACAGNDNPTISHAFLSAMEDSGSVGGDTGWEYEEMMKTFKDVDYSKLMTYELQDETEMKKELACASGTCEID